METKTIIEYTIPIWQVLCLIGGWIVTLVTVLVRLHYSDKEKKKEMTQFREELKNLKKYVDTEVSELGIMVNNELEKVKTDVHAVKTLLDKLNDTLITVRTHTELLITGKINTQDGKK